MTPDLFGIEDSSAQATERPERHLPGRLYLHMEDGGWRKVADLLTTFGVDRPKIRQALDRISTWRGVYLEWRDERREVRLTFANQSIKEDLHGVQQAAD